MKKSRKQTDAHRALKHLFPMLIGLAIILLTIMKISGSSFGIYHHFLDGGKDKASVNGEFLSIRADEWLILTPKTISQSLNDFPETNPDVGLGEDATVTPSLPTRDWSVIFRAENLSFLVLPLEEAFAFKWWFFIGGLIITSYYFSLRFFTRSIPKAVMLSLFVGFAPLIQWTYREFLFMSLITGFLMVMSAHRLAELTVTGGKSRSDKIKITLLIIALVYLVVSFTLVLYPPFQIITALVLGAFYIDSLRGIFPEKTKALKDYLSAHKYHLLALLGAFLVLVIFYHSHSDSIQSVLNTKHPGFRSFETGYYGEDRGSLRHLMSNGAMPQILEKGEEAYASHIFEVSRTFNQSEAAGAVWLLPVLVFYVVYISWRNGRSPPYFSIAAAVLIIVILLVPGLHLPLIQQVPPTRWNLAIILSSFALFGLIIKNSVDLRRRRKSSFTSGDLAMVVIIAAFALFILLSFLETARTFPALFDDNDMKIGYLIILGPLIFLAARLPFIALALVTIPTAAITYNANPLYKGFGSVLEQPAIERIAEIDSEEKGSWVVAAGVRELSPLPLLAGARSLTTHYSYPQDFWKEIDGVDEDVINRAAHIKAELTDKKTYAKLESINSINLLINPCDEDLVRSLDVKYVVTANTLSSPERYCLHKVDEFEAGSFEKIVIYRSNKL